MTTRLGPRAHAMMRREPFGMMPDGRKVEMFVLFRGDIEIRIISYGGIVTSLRVPDREGAMDDVVLGHDTLDGYLTASPYFGAIIGRYGNRIANGRFTLDGTEHQLETNNGPHHLHGGPRGFDKVVWSAEPFAESDRTGVTLSHTSPDGDQGYPGTLSAQVSYVVTDRNELVFDYFATSDRATPVNLTQHTYWNLGGAASEDICDHILTVLADGFTEVTRTLIPTGVIASVEGTPFDFREPSVIGDRVGKNDEQLRNAGGYDHNFVLRKTQAGALEHAVRLTEPVSGRTLDLATTEPGLQFYSGNFLDGTIRGKGGRVYEHRTGICLESQHFPDSPNQPSFPSVILRPGSEYRSRTVLTFGVDS